MSDYLEQLRVDPTFRHLLDSIIKQRPIVPVYNHHKDNTEEWKALSNMQKGFDKCLILFGEQIDE